VQLKGNKRIIGILSGVLKNELTAINQYFIHYEIAEHKGYTRLAKMSRKQSIEEMVHAEKAIERILSLDGIPNMSDYGKINVGQNIKHQLQNDLDLERKAIPYLNEGIQVCREEGDNATAELLESFLLEEEEHAEWLETQLELINEVGYENYLARQIEPSEVG
jgi:bacterioferritin